MHKFIAIVARGIEEVTKRELEALGANSVQVGVGAVEFTGDYRMLYTASLWLRTASRILMPLREFSSKTPEMLYDQVRRVKWHSMLQPETTISVHAVLAGDAPDRMQHTHFLALKIKDAIVDEMRLRTGNRPNVDTHNPGLAVNAFFHNGRCSLALDTSGGSLHERHYRVKSVEAPLKETLAAALVDLSGWNGETPFLDPMCGSGTLLIEAAMKALQIAPGLSRDRFGFENWPDFDEKVWREVRAEAESRKLTSLKEPIVGHDQDESAVAATKRNAQVAGVGSVITVSRQDIGKLQPVGTVPGTLLTNPPYGERLGDIEEVKVLYKHLGDLMKHRMKGWTACIFTGSIELAKSVGLKTSQRVVLYNGSIESRLLKYELYEGKKA